MKKLLLIIPLIGIFAIFTSAKANQGGHVCPRGSTGFIQVGNRSVCLSPDPQQRPAAATTRKTPQPAAPKAAANRELDNDLNTADLRFRDGNIKSACGWVSIAISSANRDGASTEQASQLKDYAKRCNLRY
jgi:hypothetical protein